MALDPQLTAVLATATQTGSSFSRPFGAKSGLITFNVISGTTVNLTVSLEAQAGNDAWIEWFTDTTAITGVSSRVLLLSPYDQTNIGSGIDLNFVAPLPETMRFKVTHVGVNAATYSVTMDFF